MQHTIGTNPIRVKIFQRARIARMRSQLCKRDRIAGRIQTHARIVALPWRCRIIKPIAFEQPHIQPHRRVHIGTPCIGELPKHLAVLLQRYRRRRQLLHQSASISPRSPQLFDLLGRLSQHLHPLGCIFLTAVSQLQRWTRADCVRRNGVDDAAGVTIVGHFVPRTITQRSPHLLRIGTYAG